MSLQRCRRETTSSEFVDWKVYLDRDWDKRTPEQYYLAQVAQEIRRVLHKHPRQVRLEHFLIRFEQQGATPPPTPEEIEARTRASKSLWLGAVGMKGQA